jgi:hypothetical protein
MKLNEYYAARVVADQQRLIAMLDGHSPRGVAMILRHGAQQQAIHAQRHYADPKLAQKWNRVAETLEALLDPN